MDFLSRHVTVGAAVETVTFGQHINSLELINVDGAAAVYFTLNDIDPSVEGDNTNVLPAAPGASVKVTLDSFTIQSSVKLIASSDCKVAIIGA